MLTLPCEVVKCAISNVQPEAGWPSAIVDCTTEGQCLQSFTSVHLMLLKHSCSTSRALPLLLKSRTFPLLLKSRTPPLLLKRSNATNLHRWLGSASAPDHQGMCTLSRHPDHDYFLWYNFSECLSEVKNWHSKSFSQHSGGFPSYLCLLCWTHELQNNLNAVMNSGTRNMSRFSNLSIISACQH